MQTCFFAISGVLPREEAIQQIKHAAELTYGKRGKRVVEQNFRAIDATLEHLHQVEVPSKADSDWDKRAPVPAEAPEFVQQVTGEIIAGRGDAIPVSLLPADGTFPLRSRSGRRRFAPSAASVHWSVPTG